MARILLIDDEDKLRIMVADYLEDEGHTVVQAPDGAAGLDLFQREQPELTLLDLRMPGMDGLDVLSTINEQSPSAPVIVVSGAGRVDDVIEALRLGAWDYLNKPLADLAILKHSVDTCLERSRLLKEREEHQRRLEQEVERRTHELQQAKTEIMDQFLFMETLFQSIPSPIYYRDLSGRILNCNEALAALVKLPREQILGNKAESFFDDSMHELLSSLDERLFTDRRPQHFEAVVNAPGESSPRHMMAGRALVRDVEGLPQGVVGILNDVTAQRAAEHEASVKEQQLIHADKMISLGVLTAGVAHEINNPNHLIMLNISTLKDLWLDMRAELDRVDEQQGISLGGAPYADMRESVANLLDTVQEAAARIRNIVRDMKEFSRLDPSHENELLDLNEVAVSAVNLVTRRMEKVTTNFTVHYHPQPLMVLGNKGRLEQVMINLMVNAAEALAGRPGAVTVHVRPSDNGRTAIFSVTDEGPGISTEVRGRIKDPFFTTKRESGGVGLGLAISDTIAKAHEGSLQFESPESGGAKATLTLPLQDAARP